MEGINPQNHFLYWGDQILLPDSRYTVGRIRALLETHKMKYTTLTGTLLMMICSIFFCSDPSTSPKPTGMPGDQLAQQWCGSCHEYTPPMLLSKSIWKEDVLPAMAHRMGIYYGKLERDSLLRSTGHPEILKKSGIYPETPLLAWEDWEKIVEYFMELAPEATPGMDYPVHIIPELTHFEVREVEHVLHPALTTLVKILPEGRGAVFADTKPGVSKLITLDKDLQFVEELNFRTTPIQYDTQGDTLLITTIGNNPFPSDKYDGDFQMVYRSTKSKPYDQSKILVGDLIRPVQVLYGDLDQDGLEDLVVCEFGHHIGRLAWYRNHGDGHTRHILKEGPGAIQARITDWDGDGLQDILVLMSQGREGLFLLKNAGNTPIPQFTEEQLLSFSPLHGSQYFELHDFNKDGHLDVLYVCGDNADKTPILKDYHGVYIFENDGSGNLSQSWFFHQNGAYKAMAADFDGDGDLDIASISFFPDYVERPEESFVYLENQGEMKFTPYSFPQSQRGRWMVMDIGDLDQDGDLDILLGSFVYFIPMGDTTGLGDWWMNEGPSVLVLENKIK